HYGRFGRDSERLYPMFIGNDFYVRGYNNDDLYQRATSEESKNHALTVNQLIGSRISMINAEMRIPLTGPEKLTLLKSRLFFSDLVFFGDAGLAWSKNRPVQFNWKLPNPNVNIPVYSAGASLRINLFGYMVLEPYLAVPFQRFQAKPHFGIFFSGGWW
ncbi:MAG: BamA/TamA family outer membrane protein, partial [Bacteroidota bacterium]|nr:BamA/TamA family outer membrane protein [Bacteroidota bacterium]